MEGGNTCFGRKYARERLDAMVDDQLGGFILAKRTDEIVTWVNREISGGSRMTILHSMALVCADVCLSVRTLKNWRGL